MPHKRVRNRRDLKLGGTDIGESSLHETPLALKVGADERTAIKRDSSAVDRKDRDCQLKHFVRQVDEAEQRPTHPFT